MYAYGDFDKWGRKPASDAVATQRMRRMLLYSAANIPSVVITDLQFHFTGYVSSLSQLACGK